MPLLALVCSLPPFRDFMIYDDVLTGGKEGGVASTGLADGQLSMGCQPADMRYRRGDAPRRYYYDYYRSAADMVQS